MHIVAKTLGIFFLTKISTYLKVKTFSNFQKRKNVISQVRSGKPVHSSVGFSGLSRLDSNVDRVRYVLPALSFCCDLSEVKQVFGF